MSNELIELQTQLAFQEQTISELNDALTSQQQQIDLLRMEIKLLKDNLGMLEDRIESGPPQNEKPPHY
jgi:SlyX protein